MQRTPPRPLPTLIGRSDQVAELIGLLSQTRLLTLTGIGGVGKSRLALEVSTKVEAQIDDGVYFVELAPVNDEAGVLRTILATIRAHENSAETPTETLLTYFQEKNCLLVLDNCEHVIDISARIVRRLLQHCHKLQILITSREAFGWPEEIFWPVPALSLPDNTTSSTHSDIAGSSACQLFLERARHIAPHFSLTDENAATVASICQQLDGIPLAIELAAARLRVFSLSQIAERLDEHFDTAIRSQHIGVARHQTLHASIDWSFQLLTQSEQVLLASLALFKSSANLKAIEHICAASQLPDNPIAPALSGLVEKSLVEVQNEHQEPRFKLLETVRQFAAQKLKETDVIGELRTRHLAWYVAIAEQTGANPETNTVDWLSQLDHEQFNFVLALEWAEDSADFVSGWRLSGALADYWLYRGRLAIGMAWYQHFLTDLQHPDIIGAEFAFASALLGAGTLSYHLGSSDAAKRYLTYSLQVSEQHQLFSIQANTLNILGGVSANFDQDSTKAHQQYGASLQLYRQLNDAAGIGQVSSNLAVLYSREEQYKQANDFFQESVAFQRQAGDPQKIAFALYNLAGLNLRQGEYQKVARHLTESILIGWQSGNVLLLSYLLEAIAVSCFIWEAIEGATLFFGAASANRERYGIVDPNIVSFDVKPFHEQCQAKLGAEKFVEAWSSGVAESAENVVAFALKTLDEQLQKVQQGEMTNKQNPYGLTPREIDVITLVATGITDAQVALQLAISPRTVHKHLSSIYKKLAVDSRTGATRLVLEQHII